MKQNINNFIETLDLLCYEAFINLIGIGGLLCWILVSWISFFWSIGCLIHLEFKEGFLALFVCLLSIVIWRGSIKLYEKLDLNKTNKKKL